MGGDKTKRKRETQGTAGAVILRIFRVKLIEVERRHLVGEEKTDAGEQSGGKLIGGYR